MGTTTTAEREEEAEELSPTDELYRISEATNDDGTIDVELHDWEKDGDDVTVDFILPTGEVVSERMRWPLRDDPEEYKFVRVVGQAGYDLVTAESLKGSNAEVSAERSGDSWQLHVPQQPSVVERVRSAAPPLSEVKSRTTLFIGAPLFLLVGFAKAGDPASPGIGGSAREYRKLMEMTAFGCGLILWTFVFLILLAAMA